MTQTWIHTNSVNTYYAMSPQQVATIFIIANHFTNNNNTFAKGALYICNTGKSRPRPNECSTSGSIVLLISNKYKVAQYIIGNLFINAPSLFP